MISENLNAALFSFLLNKKKLMNPLSSSEEIDLWEIANNYLYSGFLTSSLIFDEKNGKFSRALEDFSKAYLVSFLSKKADLLKIAKELNKRKIVFVVLKGMALNLEKIYKPGIRQLRDIDILVRKKDIKATYELLRSMGYKYTNAEAEDKAEYLHKCHLPAMQNDKKTTVVELHWRATEKSLFKECPLTELLIKERQESSLHNFIFVPSLNGLLAHALYHGVLHHNLDHGPIFLFDILQIYKSNGEKWPMDIEVIKKMGLLNTFFLVKQIIEQTKSENSLSMKSTNLINDLFKDFNWSSEDKKISLFGLSDKRFTYKKLFLRFKNSFNILGHEYQLPKTSFKYWVIFFKKVIYFIKKAKL